MKLKRELLNGFIIFIGIGIYFIFMELLGLSDEFYLRIFNLFIVAFGVNLTLKQNVKNGVHGYFKNLISGILTSFIGAVLSVGGLYLYIKFKGSKEYLKSLSENFLFGGGDINATQYSIALLFESIASSVVISFILMQYWKNKVETINKVD